jgi:CO/xanthine dehydrogenase Mo-binding subunit
VDAFGTTVVRQLCNRIGVSSVVCPSGLSHGPRTGQSRAEEEVANAASAIQGRNALKIDWDDGPNASYSSDAYKAQMQASARQPGQVVRSEGDVASALARAAKRIDAEYYIPHVAHATMEPPAAIVRVTEGKCEAWACVQGPQLARERLAKHLDIPLDGVTVHQTLLGGGFGRKLPARLGLGIAAHRSFVTYTAAVIEVAVGDKGEITVPRVDIAVDCGPQVNPDRIRSQLEGTVIMGLSVAMRGGITFKNGRVEQSNFHQYTVLRMNEAPRDIRVYIVPASYDIPLGGVGEPGLHPSHRRCAMRSLPQPASGSARCRSPMTRRPRVARSAASLSA